MPENSSFDQEEKSVLFMTEEEKQHKVLYDNKGNPLYYDGEGNWIPIKAFVTKEEVLRVKARHPKPKIYPYRIISMILAPIIMGALINLLVYFLLKANNLTIPFNNYLIIFFSFIGLYTLLHLGSIAIFVVTFYQAVAKDEIRERCKMTPTCSQYMKYAIQKYGFIIGLIKGIIRLKRCEGQDEIDWP